MCQEFKTLDVLSKLEGLWLNRNQEIMYAGETVLDQNLTNDQIIGEVVNTKLSLTKHFTNTVRIGANACKIQNVKTFSKLLRGSPSYVR